MPSSENIAGETQEISALVAGVGSVNVYEVPTDYFDSLPSTILNHINESEDQDTREELAKLSTLLADVPNSVPYEIPGSYFNELADDVVSGARAIDFVNQELEMEASLLHQTERKNVYTVPGGYFFKLPYIILQSVRTADSKVSFLNKYKKVLGFAAAALFAGVMSVASWSYFHQRMSSNNEGIAHIDRISADEISHYLENVPVYATDTVGYNISTIHNDEIKLLLADVSNEELEKYLDLNSVSKVMLSE